MSDQRNCVCETLVESRYPCTVCEEEHDRGVRGEVFQKRGQAEKERKKEREKERGQKLVVREGRRDSRGGICGKGKRGERVGLERGRDR